MPRPAPVPFEADIAAALDWWREAGVDAVFADEARGWLADPATPEPAAPKRSRNPEAAPAPAPVPQLGGPRENWPRDLASFRDWWLTEPALDEGGLSPRIAPSGAAGAELMVLVPMPEEGDREALLSSREGALLDGFLASAGIATDQVYRAAVLPRHMALPDWRALEAHGIGALLAHHVALAAPKRLLAFGRNIPPLCGHNPAQARAQGAASQPFFNHENGRVPALFFEAGLDRLLDKPALRARLWKRWLDWTDG